MQVCNRGNFIHKGCELVEMGSKQTETLDLGGDIPMVVTRQYLIQISSGKRHALVQSLETTQDTD